MNAALTCSQTLSRPAIWHHTSQYVGCVVCWTLPYPALHRPFSPLQPSPVHCSLCRACGLRAAGACSLTCVAVRSGGAGRPAARRGPCQGRVGHGSIRVLAKCESLLFFIDSIKVSIWLFTESIHVSVRNRNVKLSISIINSMLHR
jgi:hypothetical protein